MKENVVAEKSLEFAVEIVRICGILMNEKKEYVLSRQVLRSGTAIGALVREAEHAESAPDFIHKMSVALKEANETGYWLILLEKSGFCVPGVLNKVQKSCSELIMILVKIIKTMKSKRAAT